MTSLIAEELQQLVRQAALPIQAGETVAAQMRRSWERLGRPAWWRLKACWYAEAGCFSAQAARDLQDRFTNWREAESLRTTQSAEIEKLTRARRDREALEATRAEYRAQLARIERQLAACDTAVRLYPTDEARP